MSSAVSIPNAAHPCNATDEAVLMFVREHCKTMTPGNVDLLGQLCATISNIRASYDNLKASITSMEIERRKLVNELEKLKSDMRRLQDRLERPADFVRTLS